jgi:hypothetical protein
MHPAGRRRSNRIPKTISIILSGSDIEGKQFSEQTKTLVLSRHGAGIVSINKLAMQERCSFVAWKRTKKQPCASLAKSDVQQRVTSTVWRF